MHRAAVALMLAASATAIQTGSFEVQNGDGLHYNNSHSGSSRLSSVQKRGRPIQTLYCYVVAKVLNAAPSQHRLHTHIGAQQAYDCQTSIPFVDNIVDETINSIYRMNAFEATLEYMDHEDLDFDVISRNAHDGRYETQLDFEQAITSVFARARDVNFHWRGAVDSLFQYHRSDDLKLVSVEMDDGTMQIQLHAELNDEIGREVAIINDRPVLEFLQDEADSLPFEDPRARWNALFAVSGTPGLFVSPNRFPGQRTEIFFTDGTSVMRENYATVTRDDSWQNVYDGHSAYNTFVKKDSTSTAQTWEGRHPLQDLGSSVLYGRLLELVGTSEAEYLGVLSLGSLGTRNPDELVDFLNQFLEGTQRSFTPRLAIDLRGTWRGSHEQAVSMIHRLFPWVPYNQLYRFRTNEASELMGAALSRDISDEDHGADLFQFQNFRRPTASLNEGPPNEQLFASWADVCQVQNPHDEDIHGGYSNIFTRNLPSWSPVPSEGRLYDPTDIVLVLDGTCSGPCSKFVDDMLHLVQGVRTVYVGGPYPDAELSRRVPVLGGTKGGVNMSLSNLHALSARTLQALQDSLPDDDEDDFVQQAANILPVEPPIQIGWASVNLFNHYRPSTPAWAYQFLPPTFAECVIHYDRDNVDDFTVLFTRIWQAIFGHDGEGDVDLCD